MRHLDGAKGEREVDVVVEGMDVGHFLWFREQFLDDVVNLVVIYSGQFAYQRTDGVAVVPLALLGA